MGLLDSLINAGSTLIATNTQNAFNQAEAEKQRQFASEQAKTAYERSLEADSSKYQREVQDMLRAGINPMLAADGSTGSVQASPASGVAASSAGIPNIGAILAQTAAVDAQRRLAAAQERNINADTLKKESETAGINIDNDIKEVTKTASIEAASLQNDLTRGKIKQIDAGLDEISARISKMAAETTSETEKASLYAAQRLYTAANARQIIELLPYEKALRSAKTESERQAALLAAAHTAYQNKLIDDGYIDSFIRNMSATASSAEYKAELDEIKTALRTGSSVPGVLKNGGVAGHLLQSLTIFLDNLNPLGSLVK